MLTFLLTPTIVILSKILLVTLSSGCQGKCPRRHVQVNMSRIQIPERRTHCITDAERERGV